MRDVFRQAAEGKEGNGDSGFRVEPPAVLPMRHQVRELIVTETTPHTAGFGYCSDEVLRFKELPIFHKKATQILMHETHKWLVNAGDRNVMQHKMALKHANRSTNPSISTCTVAVH